MFYDNVKSLCKTRGITLTELMRELKMSTSLPTQWKKGQEPKPPTMLKIAEYFGVTIDFLLSDRTENANNVGIARNSTIMQGVTGRDISVGAPASSGLSEYEEQLLGIVRQLDLKSRTALLMHAIELQENMK